jgi:hypothetical protein
MHEDTKKSIQATGNEIRGAAQAAGHELGTADAAAWVRENWPEGEFWDFVAGPDPEQGAPCPDAVFITMNADPPHPPRTLADYEGLAGPEAGS